MFCDRPAALRTIKLAGAECFLTLGSPPDDHFTTSTFAERFLIASHA